MDFFEHQDQARRATRILVGLFTLAVLSLIAITTVLVYGLFFYAGETAGAQGMPEPPPFYQVAIMVSLAVIVVVALGSLFRMSQLRGGGHVVAEALGGRLLSTASRDPDERKVLNVVEEMAIASGMPVPPVYLMEEAGINAFAAGTQHEDAVIGVTRGCIQTLNRDELQGVIAHEFSHILHGDMRVNIRLMGILFGIMVLGIIGYQLLRGGAIAGGRNRNNGGVVALGLGLIVVGFSGVFFGNLIKAAVSRQREFLADASAVQYTRNPAGIAGALKKIGGHAAGSALPSTDTTEISHMLFEEGKASSFNALFATHPPLDVRIRRIEPDWQPDSPSAAESNASASSGDARVAGLAGNSTGSSHSSDAAQSADNLIESIANPSTAQVGMAADIISALPPVLYEAAHESADAPVVIMLLVIRHTDQAFRARQQTLLTHWLPPAQQRNLTQLSTEINALPRTQALTLAELAVAALKSLSEPQQQRFLQHLVELMQVDETVSLFDWCLFTVVRESLQPTRMTGQHTALGRAHRECHLVLTQLAVAGHTDLQEAQQALDSALQPLGLAGRPLLPAAELSLQSWNESLRVLRKLRPGEQRRFLQAMIACVQWDGRIAPVEGELLRVVALLLGCPLPPTVWSDMPEAQ